MKTLDDTWNWLADSAHWAGDDGIWHRLAQHLVLTVACLVVSCLIALPVAFVLGHIGKGGVLAVNISNVGRAVPTFAVLVLLLLTPVGAWGEGPTVVALVLFAVPPLLTNAYVACARSTGCGAGRTGDGDDGPPDAVPRRTAPVAAAGPQRGADRRRAARRDRHDRRPGGRRGLGRIITAGSIWPVRRRWSPGPCSWPASH